MEAIKTSDLAGEGVSMRDFRAGKVMRSGSYTPCHLNVDRGVALAEVISPHELLGDINQKAKIHRIKS